MTTENLPSITGYRDSDIKEANPQPIFVMAPLLYRRLTLSLHVNKRIVRKYLQLLEKLEILKISKNGFYLRDTAVYMAIFGENPKNLKNTKVLKQVNENE